MRLPGFSRLLASASDAGLLLPALVVVGVLGMHVVVALLYAVLVWACVVIWLLAAGGPWGLVLALGPVVISALVVVFLLLGAMVAGARWLWLSRGTLRLWR